MAAVIRNAGFEGYVQLFQLPDGYDLPADDASGDELGLRWSGIRYESSNGEPRLAFGLATRRRWSILQPIATEVYLDLDRNGVPEIRLRLATAAI